MLHGLGQLHAVGHRVGAFDGGDDALHPGQPEEGVDGLLVVDDIVLDSADLLQEGVLRAGGGVIQTAGNGVDGGGLAVFILEHDGVEAVHDALGAVLQAGGMVAQLGAAAQRLNTVNIHGVIQEAGEEAGSIGAAAHTGNDGVRQLAGHLDKLLSCFDTYDTLEITHH